jgi:hypothetical protein
LADDDPVVEMVRVAACAVVPAIVNELPIEQVGGYTPPDRLLTLQDRFTGPRNPFEGVTVIVVVPCTPAETEIGPLFDSAIAAFAGSGTV